MLAVRLNNPKSITIAVAEGHCDDPVFAGGWQFSTMPIPRELTMMIAMIHVSAMASWRSQAMLQFDARRRPTAAEALAHAYLADLHDEEQAHSIA